MKDFANVYINIHADEKYHDLDDLGKLVFLTILTHPCLTSIGTITRSIEEFILGLGPDCEPERFQAKVASFNKLVELGMVEYDSAGLIALPNYLEYNPPSSPMTEKELQKLFNALPDCELKNHVIARYNEKETELFSFWDDVTFMDIVSAFSETVGDRGDE